MRLAHQLETDIPDVEKLQIAAYAPRITHRLGNARQADHAALLRAGPRHRRRAQPGRLHRILRPRFLRQLDARRAAASDRGRRELSDLGAVGAGQAAGEPGPEVLAEIRALDERLEGKPGEPIARLRVGIVAVLGRSGEAESLAYLRNVYYQRSGAPRAGGDEPHAASGRRELADPGRFAADGRRRAGATKFSPRWRKSIASRRPRSRIATRSCSACACRRTAASWSRELLEKWIGQTPYKPDAPLAEQLAAWQTWYATTFPNELPAELPKESQPNKWSYEELLSLPGSPKAKRAARRAAHRYFNDAPVHQLPSLQRPGRRHRPRSDDRRPAVPAEGNPGVDRLSEPGRLGSVREPDRDRRRQDVHRHRRPQAGRQHDRAASGRAERSSWRPTISKTCSRARSRRCRKAAESTHARTGGRPVRVLDEIARAERGRTRCGQRSLSDVSVSNLDRRCIRENYAEKVAVCRLRDLE